MLRGVWAGLAARVFSGSGAGDKPTSDDEAARYGAPDRSDLGAAERSDFGEPERAARKIGYGKVTPVSSSQMAHRRAAAAVSFARGATTASPTLPPRIS